MRLQTKAWAQEGWAGAGDVGASTQTWGYKQKMHEPAKEENVEEEGMGREPPGGIPQRGRDGGCKKPETDALGSRWEGPSPCAGHCCPRNRAAD